MNTSANGKFRPKKNSFTQVSNAAIRDENLSLRAKGLYSIIQSYITIENFTLYKGTLVNSCMEKGKGFENTWNELKEKGYLKQYRIRAREVDDKGNVIFNGFKYEYELLDVADLTTPSLISVGLNGEIILKNTTYTVPPQNGYSTTTTTEIVPPPNEPGTNRTMFAKVVSNNTNTNNTYLYNQSINHNTYIEEPEVIKEENDTIDYEKAVSKNIEYRSLKRSYGKIVDDIYRIMVDTLEDYPNTGTISIGCMEIAAVKVKKRLLELGYFDIIYVIECYEKINNEIFDKEKYLLKCLYNAKKTINAHYHNQVMKDDNFKINL